jgi:hypothetical protein
MPPELFVPYLAPLTLCLVHVVDHVGHVLELGRDHRVFLPFRFPDKKPFLPSGLIC